MAESETKGRYFFGKRLGGGKEVIKFSHLVLSHFSVLSGKRERTCLSLLPLSPPEFFDATLQSEKRKGGEKKPLPFSSSFKAFFVRSAVFFFFHLTKPPFSPFLSLSPQWEMRKEEEEEKGSFAAVSRRDICLG